MIRNIFLLFSIIFLFSGNVYSENIKIAYVDMDFIILNSNIGKKIIKQINNIDANNIKKLEKKNNELKENELNLKNKENILSQEVFDEELNLLKKKIKEYNVEKNNMVKNLNDFKNKEINKVLKNISPILEAYMKENSIDIILNSKNLIIANSKLDITKKILDEVNKKL